MNYKNERHFSSEKQRNADKRDERLADIIAVVFALVLIGSLLVK